MLPVAIADSKSMRELRMFPFIDVATAACLTRTVKLPKKSLRILFKLVLQKDRIARLHNTLIWNLVIRREGPFCLPPIELL